MPGSFNDRTHSQDARDLVAQCQQRQLQSLLAYIWGRFNQLNSIPRSVDRERGSSLRRPDGRLARDVNGCIA